MSYHDHKLVDTRFGPEWKEAVEEAKAEDVPSALMQELEELRAWKREALLVESTWNEQAVGRALGMTLGCSIRPRILEGIARLKGTIRGLLMIMEMQGYTNTAKMIHEYLMDKRIL
jgi:hypothetical protein